MKNLLSLICLALITATTFSCGKKTSPYSAEAKKRAVQAAEALIAVDHTDTFAIQSSLLAAEATRSEYIIMDDTIAAGDFDRSFRETLNQKDPELAKAIFK